MNNKERVLPRVYTDYGALYNYVVRVVDSCMTPTQLEVAYKIYRRAILILTKFHKDMYVDFLIRVSALLMNKADELNKGGEDEYVVYAVCDYELELVVKRRY